MADLHVLSLSCGCVVERPRASVTCALSILYNALTNALHPIRHPLSMIHS